MRRQMFIAAGAAAAVLVLGFVFLVRPVGAEIGKVRKQVEEAQGEEQNLRLRIRQLRQAQQNAPAVAAQLAKFDLLLPRTANLPTFIRQVQEAADDSGIELTSIAPSPPAVVSAGPGSDPALAGKGVFQLNVVLNVSGGFFRMKSFVQRLEGLQRIVVVSSISMSPASQDSPGELQSTITMQMYLVNPAATTTTGVARPTTTASPSPSPGGQSGPATPAPTRT